VIRGVPRLLTSTPWLVASADWLLTGAPRHAFGTLTCCQTYHNQSHGTLVPDIGDHSYFERQPECPPRVWYSPEFDASMSTHHILSDTPEGSQQLKYILCMLVFQGICRLHSPCRSWSEFQSSQPFKIHSAQPTSNSGDLFSMWRASSSDGLLHWVQKVVKTAGMKKWYSDSLDGDVFR